MAGDTEKVYLASAYPMLGKVIRDKLLMSLLRHKMQELKRKGVLKSFYIPELIDSGGGGWIEQLTRVYLGRWARV